MCLANDPPPPARAATPRADSSTECPHFCAARGPPKSYDPTPGPGPHQVWSPATPTPVLSMLAASHSPAIALYPLVSKHFRPSGVLPGASWHCHRSADWQSAVSRIGNPPTCRIPFGETADCQSALQASVDLYLWQPEKTARHQPDTGALRSPSRQDGESADATEGSTGVWLAAAEEDSLGPVSGVALCGSAGRDSVAALSVSAAGPWTIGAAPSSTLAGEGLGALAATGSPCAAASVGLPAVLRSDFGGLGAGFLAVSRVPSANSMTWP